MPWNRYRRSSYSSYTTSYNTDSTYPAYPVTQPGKQHRHFTSPIEFAAWLTEKGVGTNPRLKYWEGLHSETPDQAREKTRQGVELLVKGDETYVEDARKLLNEMQEKIEAPSTRWGHSLVGAFPDIPRFLAGDPEDMWYREPSTSDRTPLRIFVGTSCSWVIKEADLRKRGIVLAAFAIAIADIRPVYIVPFMNSHDYNGQHHGILSYDIGTSPLVLSQLLPCVSDPRIGRYVWINSAFCIQSRVGAGVPFVDIKRSDIPGIAPGDMYLPPISAHDPLLQDPVGWLKTNIAHYSNPDHDYDISTETLTQGRYRD